MRILVVDDDSRVSRTVGLGLRTAGYEVEHAADGDAAIELATSRELDLIVLDLVLPGRDGIEVLGALRARGVRIPILVLTGKARIEDRVAGLDAGADDYLTKPFGLEELVARVRALLRRRGDMVETVFKAGDLEVDALRRRATRNGVAVDLTNREFDLLEFLFRHANQVVSRAALTEQVWGYPFDAASNFVDVHVAHLRAKIDGGGAAKLVHTVRGQGYMLRTTDAAGE